MKVKSIQVGTITMEVANLQNWECNNNHALSRRDCGRYFLLYGGSCMVFHQHNSVGCDQWHSIKLWFSAFSRCNFYGIRYLFLETGCCLNYCWWNIVHMVVISFLSSSKFASLFYRPPSEWWSRRNLIAAAPLDLNGFFCRCHRCKCAYHPFDLRLHRLFRDDGLLWGVQYFPLSL